MFGWISVLTNYQLVLMFSKILVIFSELTSFVMNSSIINWTGELLVNLLLCGGVGIVIGIHKIYLFLSNDWRRHKIHSLKDNSSLSISAYFGPILIKKLILDFRLNCSEMSLASLSSSTTSWCEFPADGSESSCSLSFLTWECLLIHFSSDSRCSESICKRCNSWSSA